MEQKAWIDVKSPRFFIWKAIQYVGVIGSGVKHPICWGDWIWCETCAISNKSAK
jgi:hypothetical protein